MSVLSPREVSGYEQVVACADAATGLSAIIAIHDTTLGPALGGCRFWRYPDEAAAMEDVLRLARGMTYKAALAGLRLGGGKSVIVGDPRADKTPALLEAFGRCVEQLGGRYIVAEDVGTTPADMACIRKATRHVAGLAEPGFSGDPSPATAFGVFEGIRAAVRHRLRRERLDGLRVAVQGLGAVGYRLCERLAEAGARLTVCDINPEATARARAAFGATVVPPEDIYDAPVELFAPCALGAVIDDATIGRLRAAIVAGSANNQLAEARHGAALAARGILYAPDYAINAGGLINVAHGPLGRPGHRYDREQAFAAVARIGQTLAAIFERAEREGLPTNVVADHIAEERLRRERRAA
jgi:leucine dehydrogenase